MSRMRSLAVGAALLSLAGCAAGSTVGGTVSTIATDVQNVCAEALPLADLVPSIGIYATAFCSAANLVGKTLSGADLAWISTVLGELKGSIKPGIVAEQRA